MWTDVSNHQPFSLSVGGQAERSDQGCWSHCGALLAKSVCQGEKSVLVVQLFKHVGWPSTAWSYTC